MGSSCPAIALAIDNQRMQAVEPWGSLFRSRGLGGLRTQQRGQVKNARGNPGSPPQCWGKERVRVVNANRIAERIAECHAAGIRKIDGMPVGEIVGVVLPERPVFDKIVAFFLFLLFGLELKIEEVAALKLERDQDGAEKETLQMNLWGGSTFYRGRTPQGVKFASGGNRPTQNQESRWKAARRYLIDIGRNKYQQRNTASAAECVALDCGLIQKWGLERLFQATHEWITGTQRGKARALRGLVWDEKGKCEVDAHKVVDEIVTDARERVALHYVLFASRNNGTGYLKQSHHSVVFLLRELQKPEVLTDDERPMWCAWTIPGIVRWVLDVLVADFEVRVGSLVGTLERRPVAQLKSLDMWQVFADKDLAGETFADFNLASYLRNLFDLGVSESGISAIAERVLVDVVGQTQTQSQKARECLALADKIPFAGGMGIILTSQDPAIADNPRVVRELWRTQPLCRIAIIVNSRKQVSILTDGNVPLGKVADKLMRREPNRWFYDPRIGAILNGGHSFTKTPATKILLGDITRLIESEDLAFRER